MISQAEVKIRFLEEGLRGLPGAIVAYSGGVDSALLAEVCHSVLGERSLAVTADSPSIPRREIEFARAFARQRGWRHLIVRTSELEDENYAINNSDRCYWCKTHLFEKLQPISTDRGYPILLGTVTDDLGDHRPGLRSASERGVLQPLVDADFTKTDVREASAQLGLSTAGKPAAACLASRFAYGVRVTAGGLRRVEKAEDFLLWDGFSVVRVRDLGENRSRVEVGSSEVPRLLARRDDVVAKLTRLGFSEVHLDERGYRSGAMNEALVSVSIGRAENGVRKETGIG